MIHLDVDDKMATKDFQYAALLDEQLPAWFSACLPCFLLVVMTTILITVVSLYLSQHRSARTNISLSFTLLNIDKHSVLCLDPPFS